MYAVVARSTSGSRRQKHLMPGALLEVQMSKKCTLLWREAHFQVKRLKAQHADQFWRFRCGFAWQAQGIPHLAKSEQNMRVLQHFQKRWQAWDMRRWSAKMHLARQAQYKRHVRHQRYFRRSGRWFHERGYILEHQIFSLGKMILRDRCSTSYDLARLHCTIPHYSTQHHGTRH